MRGGDGGGETKGRAGCVQERCVGRRRPRDMMGLDEREEEVRMCI